MQYRQGLIQNQTVDIMNENGLYQPLTGNMKNKDLPLFITSFTIRCNAMTSIYVSVLLVLLIAGKMLLSHSHSK